MAELCAKANCKNEATDVEFGDNIHGTYCEQHEGETNNEIDRFGDALDIAGR